MSIGEEEGDAVDVNMELTDISCRLLTWRYQKTMFWLDCRAM
jgi:hypothetical protein